MMPVQLSNLFNITFIIDGTILASDDHLRWPVQKSNKKRIPEFITIEDSSFITITGNGIVDG